MNPALRPAIREDHRSLIPFELLFLPPIQWTTYRCPFCEAAFRRDYWGANVRLGSRERTCAKCGYVFDDGKREWPELGFSTKLRLLVPPWLIVVVPSGFVAALVFGGVDQINWRTASLLVAVSLAPAALWWLVRIFPIRRSIHRYESELAAMRRRLEN